MNRHDLLLFGEPAAAELELRGHDPMQDLNDPADLKLALRNALRRLGHLQMKIEDLKAQLDALGR